ncbi:MAG TPA: hypothetical protein VLE44_03115 [Candidatus Saccharimonadales bacterium]|nr:hypothetical protein [Candidatus Saccharimonadales bacterium]
MTGYIEGIRENYRSRQDLSKIWIGPEKRAKLELLDLQIRMSNVSEKIKAKEISKIYFTPNMESEIENQIRNETVKQKCSWKRKEICSSPQALHIAALTITNIIQGTFQTKEDISFIAHPEMFEYLASLVHDNPIRAKGEDKTVYNLCSETNKNICRRLIVQALEIYVNPTPPLSHR